MQTLLRALREICCNKLVDEKILLVPTRIAGQQLVLIMAKAGIPCLNLRLETLASLSEKYSKVYLFTNGLAVVSRLVAEHIVLNILKSLSQNNQLSYFNELKITPGVSRVIYDAILDMKLAGLSPAQVQVDGFINQLKGEDLKEIYQKYQEQLEQRKLVDRVDLINIATDRLASSTHRELFIIPDWLELKPVEKQLLCKLDPAQRVTVKLSKADGVDALFANEDIAINPRIQMFQAYGEGNELREVFRRIKKNRIPFEQGAIFYTSVEPYTQFCYNLAQKYNLPVTYGQGLNIRNTRPGRLLFGFWNGLVVVLRLPRCIRSLFPVIGD